MQSWLAISISALYLAALFAIASLGDCLTRDKPLFARGSVSSAVVYALTLGIHITAWSFYGGVGRAAAKGFDYMATSIGAFLFLIFGQDALRRVIAISKARNITSVSDFLSALYGKRRPIAAFVALASLAGILPYIALQLKAVAFSFDILTGSGQAAPSSARLFGATDFWAAAALAAFTMAFGVRHIHASERHRGFVLAVAFESLVKLAAFVIVALFIVYGVFKGFGDLLGRAQNDTALSRLLALDWSQPDWWSKIAVAFFSFLCMPQFFHVAVVENDDPMSVRPAACLYPAYVLMFAAFMTPVAIAGLVTLGGRVDPDTFMIALPMVAGAPSMGLLAFIGGLSAAAGMTMVSTAALSTMLCNDIIVPLLLRLRAQGASDMSALLLTIRRALVAAILLCAFAMRRSIDDRASLVEMGVLSVVAAAQLAPAFFGGLYWRKANGAGALAGMMVGLAVWFYSLLLPSMAGAFGLSGGFLDDGPWMIGWLRPQGLFGTGFLDPVTHATLWSLSLNVGAFVVLSLAKHATHPDRENALAFEPVAEAGVAVGRADTVRDLAAVAAQFVGTEHAEAAFGHYAKTRARRSNGSFDLTTRADESTLRFAEELIAGAIGAASARIVLAGALRGRKLSSGSARAMITDASAALHEKHVLLRAITESVPQGICALDAQLRLSAWNSRFSELLDLPSDFLKVGLPLSEIVAFNRARGEYRDDQLERLFVNRDPAKESWPYVYERTRPDGTVLEVTFNRMDVGGYVATYADVTDRHRAAQALRAANELLEQRVRERTLALEQAMKEAEDANAGKTRFLAAASHDLLQPLSAARLFLSAQQAYFGEAGGDGTSARKLAEFSKNALAALQSAEDILSELLYMSSLDSRAVLPAIQEVEIGTMLRQLGAEFSALADSRGLALRVVATSAVGRTDPAMLRRVLQNFLSNAIRYTPKGRVLLGCRRSGGSIRIEVWDTGVGIAENMHHEIFQEFRRLGQEPAGAEKGVGLGLAIVDRIAHLLDAPVRVCSRPGYGSMFAIEVPRTKSFVPDLAPVSPPASIIANARGLLLLCIDNDQQVRQGLAALLEQWGNRVVCASGLESAIDSLGDAIPNAVLVDYHLDDVKNGLDVLAKLRQFWAKDIPAVLITADHADEIRRAARAARCELLRKPIKPAALRRFLNRVGLGVPPSGGDE